ncbi:hypothetical protein AWN76_016405 [Rhodothermaceae bacterium RA]|nr:hypothetical protein AWN76_016405 [Rhodothermaceae bacterium RA]
MDEPDASDLTASPERLRRLAAAGYLSAEALERGLDLAGYVPDRSAWRWLLDRLLLVVGVVLLLAGIVFFFAYNWDDLGRFTRFGLIMGGILAAVVAAWRFGLDTGPGQVALLVAAVLPGPLLAVYGQVYQTGADPYGLFGTWALLVAGWVFISRSAWLWIGWLALLDVTLVLYWLQVPGPEAAGGVGLWLVLAGFHALALAAWEVGAARGVIWLRRRWAPRLIATVLLCCVTVPVVLLIFAPSEERWSHPMHLVAVPIYAGVVGGALWWYRRLPGDLFVMAAALLSGISVGTALAARLIGNWPGGRLLVALVVIGLLYLAVTWLRRHPPTR